MISYKTIELVKTNFLFGEDNLNLQIEFDYECPILRENINLFFENEYLNPFHQIIYNYLITDIQ